MRGKQVQTKHAKIQKDLISRLTKGSPERETKINYVIGCDQLGRVKRMSVSSYQGSREPYISSQGRMKDLRLRNELITKSPLPIAQIHSPDYSSRKISEGKRKKGLLGNQNYMLENQLRHGAPGPAGTRQTTHNLLERSKMIANMAAERIKMHDESAGGDAP